MLLALVHTLAAPLRQVEGRLVQLDDALQPSCPGARGAGKDIRRGVCCIHPSTGQGCCPSFYSRPKSANASAAIEFWRRLADAYPLRNSSDPLPPVAFFRHFDHILVSGTQRSGTTFFAKELAHLLEGYAHFDEFGEAGFVSRNTTMYAPPMNGLLGDNLQAAAAANIRRRKSRYADKIPIRSFDTMDVLDGEGKFVAQRPAVSHLLHTIPADERLLVVFMARNCTDVLESQNRIGWTCQNTGGRMQRRQYLAAQWGLRAYVDPHDAVCKISQDAWLKYQRPVLLARGVHVLTLAFTALRGLPGYVPRAERVGFGGKQTAVGG